MSFQYSAGKKNIYVRIFDRVHVAITFSFTTNDVY
jgi:hypothetical protein